MDQTLTRQAEKVLSDIAEHGGGTYEARTLIPFTPPIGYAVGLGGIHLPQHIVDVDAVAWALKAVTSEYESSYGGTWLNDGLVYFDAVTFFLNRENAIAVGQATGQQAIYDFGAKEAITL